MGQAVVDRTYLTKEKKSFCVENKGLKERKIYVKIFSLL